MPAAILAFAIAKYPRAGAAVMAALMALFIGVVVTALVRDGFVRQSWADYPLAYGGLVVAAVAVYWALRVLRVPSRGTLTARGVHPSTGANRRIADLSAGDDQGASNRAQEICCIISSPLVSPQRSTTRPSSIRMMSIPVMRTLRCVAGTPN